MARIYLGDIFEQVLHIKEMKTRKEIENLVFRMRHDKKFIAEIDQMLEVINSEVRKSMKPEDKK